MKQKLRESTDVDTTCPFCSSYKLELIETEEPFEVHTADGKVLMYNKYQHCPNCKRNIV